MRILDNLKFSINSIIDLYKSRGRVFYNFSLAFSIISAVFAALFAAIICFCGYIIYFPEDINNGKLFSDLISQPFMLGNFTELSEYIIIVSLGLYAVYLNKMIDDREAKPTFGNFIKSISKREWGILVVTVTVYGLIYLLTFKDLFDDTSSNLSAAFYSKHFPYEGTQQTKFYHWLNLMVDVIKMYLAYVAGLFVFIKSIQPRLDKAAVQKYLPALICFLIIAFCFNAISAHLIYYVREYIFKLIEVPFKDSIVIGIFQGAAVVALSACFLLAFGGCILFPVVFVQQNKTPMVEGLVNENTGEQEIESTLPTE